MANDHTTSTGLAGGAIALALLETPLDKGIISLADARNVLDRATKNVVPFMHQSEGQSAIEIIGEQKEKLAARRQ
jgi:hypothetical protein